MKKIDQKITDVYNFTVEFINDNGFPPSVREICAKLNIKSTATAYSYIEKLKESLRALSDRLPAIRQPWKNAIAKNAAWPWRGELLSYVTVRP